MGSHTDKERLVSGSITVDCSVPPALILVWRPETSCQYMRWSGTSWLAVSESPPRSVVTSFLHDDDDLPSLNHRLWNAKCNKTECDMPLVSNNGVCQSLLVVCLTGNSVAHINTNW